MELFTTLDHVIIYNSIKHHCLWCNRIDGQLIPTHGDKIGEAWNPICKGMIHGVIGKLQLLPGSEWKLLVITGRRFVGYLPKGVEVYNITRVGVLSLSSDVIEFDDLVLEPCPLHPNTYEMNSENKNVAQQKVQQTWNTIKTGAKNISGNTNTFIKDLKEKDKMERRLFEELIKMFNDSGSFYYSPNGDITNSRQRLETINTPYSWEQTDERFFWNKNMLSDLIDSKNESAAEWILPVLQGYIQIERCSIDHLEFLNKTNDSVDGPLCDDDDDDDDSDDDDEGWDFVDSKEKYRTAESLKEDEFDLIVISRRSRHQAGTRYKRRGVNDKGHVANYVETEQIICVLTHILSHVQVRGSVPVYWSQPGYKYRPIPQIDRGEQETQTAFKQHFDEELKKYDTQVIISLVELAGREKIIADAFIQNIFLYDSSDLVFVTFDFHEYCRGMKFENVLILTQAINSYVNNLGYHWCDESGPVVKQEGVFRVNCMDCLDRTNVVQAAIARDVMKIILRKLGRLLPDEDLPSRCRRIHNFMWANNGDAISRQYAGTAAMKEKGTSQDVDVKNQEKGTSQDVGVINQGDFTRTGERKMLGVMKDGYNSANRYYLNRFKDNYRQTVIDMMLGKSIAEDLSAIASASSTGEDDVWTSEKEEFITQLVRHSQLVLLPPDEECLGGWALIDPFTYVTPSDNPQDEDVIVMLTHKAYYVARYNDEIEELHSYQRIPIEYLEKIEIGHETIHYRNQYVFMRISYRQLGKTAGYFHTMRTIQGRSLEESKGILLSIAEVFLSLCRHQGIDLKVVESKFDKRRSKPQENIIPLSSKRTLSSSSRTRLVKAEGAVSLLPEGNKETPLTVSHRRSQSDVSPVEGSVPDITVEDPEGNEFMNYHKRFSPVPPKQVDEVVENHSMVKSQSESNVRSVADRERTTTSSTTKQQPSTNRMDNFFQKTKQALGNVAPRLRELSPSQRSKQHEDSNNKSSEMIPFKSTFQKLNDKFTNRGNGSGSSDNKNPLKILPEFRNKIQTVLSSPRTRRKPPQPKQLTAEEIELRSACKTKIIEL